MNIPINDDAPIAIPITTKTDIKFSISVAIKELFVMIGVFNTIWSLIIQPNYVSFIENTNFGNILFMITIGMVCLAILYAPCSHILRRDRTISIYGSDTITEPSMVDNIISGFQNKQEVKWSERIAHNFKYPSWASDIIHIYNNIVMTFYETTRIISNKLDNITNDIASLQLTVKTICDNQIVFENKLDQLKASQEELKASQDELRNEMRSGFEQIRNEMRDGFAEMRMLLRSESTSYIEM